MVLVDSSVWIDYLGFQSSKVQLSLEALIRPSNQVVITGVIYQEVLQGIKNQRSFQLIRKLLEQLSFLIPNAQTHYQAAELFRSLASRGKINSTIDTLIAALAIQNRISLFTLDTDFRFIAQHSDLRLYS